MTTQTAHLERLFSQIELVQLTRQLLVLVKKYPRRVLIAGKARVERVNVFLGETDMILYVTQLVGQRAPVTRVLATAAAPTSQVFLHFYVKLYLFF
jgi:hypothetical protein